MSLWTGTSLNNNRLSLMFNNMLYSGIISMTRRKNGLFYAIFGKDEVGAIVDKRLVFPSVGEVTGNKFEIQLSGRTRTIGTVAYGQAETQIVAGNYVNDTFGSFEFSLTHFSHKEFVPNSTFHQMRGNETKTQDYLTAIRNVLVESIENTIASHLHANQNQGELTIGGIPYIVDDSNTYGLNRASAGNENHQANVVPVGGAISLDTIQDAQNLCTIGGGSGRLAVQGSSVYGDIQTLIRNKVHAYSDPEWDKFGGNYVAFGPTIFVLDQRTELDSASAKQQYILSPELWKIVRKDEMMASQGIIYDPSRETSHVLPIEFYMGIGCGKPAGNAKLTGIT